MALDLFDLVGPLSQRCPRAERSRSRPAGRHPHRPADLTRADDRRPPDVQGGAVNFAAKVQQRCEPGMVLISEATADVLTTPFEPCPRAWSRSTRCPAASGCSASSVGATPRRRPSRSSAEPRSSPSCRTDGRASSAGGSAVVVVVAGAGLGKSRLVGELAARHDIPVISAPPATSTASSTPSTRWSTRSPAVASSGRCPARDRWRRWSRSWWRPRPVARRCSWSTTRSGSMPRAAMSSSSWPREQVPHLMLLVATRPHGGRDDWPHHTDTMWLRPLGADESASMLDGVAGTSSLGPATRRHHRRAQRGEPVVPPLAGQDQRGRGLRGGSPHPPPRSGVPVVVQQVLRSVLDESGVDDTTTSMAAAMGTQFDADLLAAVLGRPRSSVDADLRRLAAHEIIRRVDARRYRFTHALVRDLAYDVLVEGERVLPPRSDRRRVGGHHPDEHALIGYHHDHAGRPGPAARAKVRAARQCRTAGAYQEGKALASRAVELLRIDDAGSRCPAPARGQRARPPVRHGHRPDGLRRRVSRHVARGPRVAGGGRPGSTDVHRQDEPVGGGVLHRRPPPGRAPVVRRLPHRAALPGDRRLQPVRPRLSRQLRGRYAHAERLLRTSTDPMLEDGMDPWMAEHWPAPDDPIALGLA